ncbi:MAG TPA: alpha/beta hydrolase [Actinomycetota bacterium]|nr:alpha/beta hydrolase [Actinomycetota bacterium]
MTMRKGLIALAGAAVGIGAGVVAERSMLKRRRRNDPEAAERYGTRRGERSRMLDLPDGARLFIEETGPSRARRGIVFVHGSGLRTDIWYYQMPGIEGRRLIFYDLRGHGLSQPKGDADFSVRGLADDLLRVVEDARLEEAVIVGHSVGGMVALEAALLRPDLEGSVLRGLVLLNTTYRPAVETLAGGAAIARLERVVRRPLDAFATRPEYLDRLRKIIKPSDGVFWAVALAAFGPGASPKQVDLMYDMLAETPADVIFDLIKSYRDFDVRERLDQVRVPVLVVGGTRDRITVPGASEYLAEHLPKAELRLLDDCGHMSMLERHREVNHMLSTFCDDVLGRPENLRARERKNS